MSIAVCLALVVLTAVAAFVAGWSAHAEFVVGHGAVRSCCRRAIEHLTEPHREAM